MSFFGVGLALAAIAMTAINVFRGNWGMAIAFGTIAAINLIAIGWSKRKKRNNQSN